MNAKELYLAVGEIEDELILAADTLPVRKKSHVRTMWMLAAACACLFCFGIARGFSGNQIIWNEAPAAIAMKNIIPAYTATQTMTYEEMENYYKLEKFPTSLKGELQQNGVDSFFLYFDETGQTVYDSNQVWYQNGEKGQFLCVSMSRVTESELAPEGTEYSRIKGTNLLLTVTELDDHLSVYTARWEQNGTKVYVTESGLSQEEFLSAIKEFL